MKKLLLLAATAMLSVGASAQGWVKPEAKTHAPAELANNATLVRIYNVEYGAFVGGANAWGTQVSLLPEGLDYKLEWAENGQDFKLLTSSGAKSGKYLFRDNENDGYIDLGSQNRGFNFTISQTESGYYTIKSPNDDSTYGLEYYETADHQFMGWNNDKNIVHFAVSDLPEENIDADGNPVPYGIEWAFMTAEEAAEMQASLAPYNAAMELKAVIDNAKANYATIDCSEAEAVYNNTNSTVEELQAAKALVANAIAAVRSQEVLDGASEDNPVDGTELIENADFSAGDISGWTCTFVSGTTATNVGYQGASYTGLDWTDDETGEMGTAHFEKFIEAWANNVNEMKRDGKSFATIGDAKLCQTIYGLPAGKYKLAADVNAVQQWDKNQNPVTGVELYVMGGDIDSHISMATGDGIPEHFILNFIHSGGTVELGLRTKSTTANWIGADNFTLWYYGEINENPYKIILDGVVAGLEKKYEDMDDVIAEKSLKDAFTAALEAAQNCGSEGDDAYYQDLQASLEAAADALAKSIKAYETAYLQLEDITIKADEAGERGWEDLKDQLADYRDGLQGKYEECELTPEDAEAIAPTIAEMVAAYVAANCKAGDDVSLLLNNTDFQKNFSGWETTGSSPVWGANYGNGGGNANAGESFIQEAPVEDDGLAERWRAAFSMYQTIKNMPRGLYTLSVQGFNRSEYNDGTAPAELYAVLPDGSEQIGHFPDITDYATDDQIFAAANEGAGVWPSDRIIGPGYCPDSMSGAAWHFKNKKDGENYDYTTQFNIVMTEAGDLTIGVRCANDNQWVIFDNFRIVYQGSGAAVFAEPIAKKIEEGEKTIEKGTQYSDEYEIAGASAEAIAAWKAVVEQANAAVDSNDEDACIAAMGALDKAIAALNASNATAKKLMDKYIYATEYRLVDFNYTVDDSALSAVADLIFEGAATDAAMEEAMVALDAIFCQAVVNETEGIAEANEENPVDLSDVIANRLYASQTTDLWDLETGRGIGWNAEGVDVETSESYNVAEVWNATFATSQTLYALPTGYYRLKVKAYQRGYANNTHSAACLDSLGNEVPEHLPAKLYAGADTTCIVSVFSEIENYAAIEGTGATISGGKYDGAIVPNNMSEAANAFNNGLYENILQFQVTEAGAPVKIGIVKTTNENDAWVIWGDWRLEYVGTAKPATDPTTVVTDIEIAENGAKVIFDLTGRRVSKAQKGLYIVNGQKVLVK